MEREQFYVSGGCVMGARILWASRADYVNGAGDVVRAFTVELEHSSSAGEAEGRSSNVVTECSLASVAPVVLELRAGGGYAPFLAHASRDIADAFALVLPRVCERAPFEAVRP